MSSKLLEYLEILKSSFSEVLHTKNNQKQVAENKRKDIVLMFIAIKKESRKDKLAIREKREDLQTSKTKVDTNRLHLQNLLYEISHLKKEIWVCYLFKSLDESIDLLPVDQYVSLYGNQPDEEAHKSRVLRLQRELELRRQLCMEYNELLVNKKTIYKDILSNIERNGLFTPALKSLIKGCKPLKDVLKLSLTKTWQLEQTLVLLPQPLYIAFVNLYAIHLRPNSYLDVEIVNDNRTPSYNLSTDFTFRPHKLMLRVFIKSSLSNNDKLELDIRYFSQLNISTISLRADRKSNKGSLDFNILRYIENKDYGEIIPAPGLLYQIAVMNIRRKKFFAYLEQNNYGYPFIWIQKLCSIPTIIETEKKNIKKASLKYTIDIIERIRSLYENISKIRSQVESFISRDVDKYLPNSLTRPKCGLAQWSSVTWDEFHKTSKDHNMYKLLDRYCTYYRGVLVSGSSKLECWVCLSGKNAFCHAIWIYSLHCSKKYSAIDSVMLKELEKLVNSHYDCNLFSQLKTTMFYFDRLLSLENNSQDSQRKPLSSIRGRLRYFIKPQEYPH